MGSGASPLEKLATTLAFLTGSPQSSASRTISGTGHPARAEKLLMRPVWVSDSFDAAHGGSACGWTADAIADEAGVAALEGTTTVIFVVRISWFGRASVTSPV
jgi:hypothetical protein